MRTILLLCLSILFLPLTLAAEGLTVIGGTPDTDYSYKDNVYTVLTGMALTFSGTTTTDRIVVAEGVTADITLNNVNISFSDGDSDDNPAGTCAFYMNNHAVVKLKIVNINSIQSGAKCAAIQVEKNVSIEIEGEGTLKAQGGWGGAGIGAGAGTSCGAIKIISGTINALAGDWAFGLGGGCFLNMETAKDGIIIIDGGTITAGGSNWGSSAIMGNITINGGTVKTSYHNYSTYKNNFNGNLTITDGEYTNRTLNCDIITITGGKYTNCTIPNIIKFDDTSCTFTDCTLTFKTPVTLTKDYSGCKLNGDITIASGSYTNCTLKDNIVINDGTFTNCSISGTKVIINKGTINNTDGNRINSDKIIINGGDISINVPIGKEGNAIGSQNGKVTINGGTIIANTNTVSDGYGNNFYSSITGEVTITGGNVTAISNSNAAGIGGYGGRSLSNVDGNNITISGGIVYAESKGYGAGIGGATNHEGNNPSAGKNIKITGGTVTAISKSGTGIGGGGTTGQTENIIISGGTISLSAPRLIGITPKDEKSNDVYLAITPEIANATDVSVDDIPYYISGNHPQEKEKTADNKLYLYMTGAYHTVAVRTSNNKVMTYTATYNSGGVENNSNSNGYFTFSEGTEATPDKESVIAFEAENITTAYNKEDNALEVKLTITITEQTITTRSAAMNSVQLALSDGTTTYYSDRQTVTDSGEYTFTFDTKGLGAGEYTLTANYGGSATSLAANQQTTILTIEKTEGSTASDYEEPNTLTATYGQTLADITLSDGWAWDAPKTSVGNVSSSPNTFAATFTPADTKNYKIVSKNLSVTVNKATASDPGTPAVLSQSSVTYGTKLSDITITAGWQWADGAIVPTVNNFGYKAYFSVTDDTNYDWSGISDYDSNTHQVIRTVTVTVNKADLTADYFTFTAPTNLVYDGQAKAATVTAKDGLTGIGAITIKYYKDEAAEASEPTEVGTYTVKIDVAEGDNCNSTSDLTTPEWTFTILPKSDPPVNPPVDPDDPDDPDPDPAPVHYTVTLPAIEGATTDPAAGSYEVESWGSFSFLLTLDEGYRTDSHPVVTARGETLIPNASTGKYTIQHVRSDITVEITGIVKDVATGNETLSDGFHITTSGGLLLVTVPRAIRLYLTDTSGRLILTRQLPAGDTRIDNLAAGVYLLTLEGEKTKKIIIR